MGFHDFLGDAINAGGLSEDESPRRHHGLYLTPAELSEPAAVVGPGIDVVILNGSFLGRGHLDKLLGSSRRVGAKNQTTPREVVRLFIPRAKPDDFP